MVLYKYVCVLLVIVFWFYVLVYKIYNLLYSWGGVNIFGVIFVNNVFLGLGGEGCLSWIVINLFVVFLLFIMVYVCIFSK